MSIFNKKSRRDKRSKKRRIGGGMQTLQDRQLMAADVGLVPEIEWTGTKIEITGSDRSDQVVVDVLDKGTADPKDDDIFVFASNSAGSDSFRIRKLNWWGNERVSEIVFHGHRGNDTFENNTDRRSRAYGGRGNDTFYGGSSVDKFFGEFGNDWLSGKGGNDHLSGGSGVDSLYGSSGDDVLSGGSGSDWLFAGSGDDRLFGDSGTDRLYGGSGKDLIFGGSGKDHLYGGSGNDTLMGDSGSDHLYGGSGNDLMHGGSGNDRMYGGTGNDMLVGGDGSDRLYGDAGDDYLVAGDVRIKPFEAYYGTNELIEDGEDDRDDFLHGGSGNDIFAISDYGWGIGEDKILDANIGDRVFTVDTWEVPWADYSKAGVITLNAYGHRS